jgi:transposase-like protein
MRGHDTNVRTNGQAAGEGGEATLLDLLRFGSQALLKQAVSDEIAEYLGRGRYEHRGEEPFRGYRNGKRRTTLDTPLGQVSYDRPLVAHAPDFESRYHRPHMRRPEQFAESVADMYVHGVSTRRVKKALEAVAGKKLRLSRSTVSRITERLREEYRTWKKRDLSELKIAYLFIDAIRLGMRMQTGRKEAVLIAYALLEDGTFETISIGLGNSESNEVWGKFVSDLKSRGLGDPLLGISDGNVGAIGALEANFPTAYRQRCVRHKIENVLSSVPKDHHATVREKLNAIFYGATGLEQAKERARSFKRQYGRVYPSAVRSLESDLDQALTFYLFPTAHWRRIRTANHLERMNLEIRRRLSVVGRHPSEDGCLALVYRITKQYAEGKHGFKVNDLVTAMWTRLREEKVAMLTQLVLELEAA